MLFLFASRPSLDMHPSWTVCIFNAGGDGLYLGGLHILPEGNTSFHRQYGAQLQALG